MNLTPETPAPEVVAPHEALNAARKAPAIDPQGEQRLALAKDLFIAYLRPAFESGKAIDLVYMKEGATIAVNATQILLERLGGR